MRNLVRLMVTLAADCLLDGKREERLQISPQHTAPRSIPRTAWLSCTAKQSPTILFSSL